mgnify:FL=1
MRNFIITVNGKQYDVAVEEKGVSSVATLPAAEAVKPVVAAAPAAAAAAPAVNANGTKVTAPFPGMVKKLCVAAGTSVKAGDVILVLEAMKMDNDITAPCDGVVSFPVASGANVDTDAVLAVIG